VRLVLDTNVLVAAVRSRRGSSRQLLKAALVSEYSLLISVPLMMEYESVLTRPEHLAASHASVEDVQVILHGLATVCARVQLAYLWRPMLRDPKDEMVLETAANGSADVLCTFNTRDFFAARRFGIEVATPSMVWHKLESSL
jgi:putative PIN family toxin of toxin-antitoxin system